MYNGEGDIRESDTSVTPANLAAAGEDAYEPDNNRSEALLIQMDSIPQDHTLGTRSDEDWYQVKYSDGAGYIRIGATGPIRFEDFDQGEPAMLSESDPPGPGATLVEDVHILPHYGMKGRKDKTLYFKIMSLSDNPIVYRLSVVSERPLADVGVPTSEIAADEYLYSIASGDLRTLFDVTRLRMTTEQVTAIRDDLFGQTKPFQPKIAFRPWPDEPDEQSELKLVQRMIGGSLDPDLVQAFVVTCEENNRLFVVVSAHQDLSLSAGAKAAFIKKVKGAGKMTHGKSPKSTFNPVVASGVLLIAFIIALVLLKRKKLNQHSG